MEHQIAASECLARASLEGLTEAQLAIIVEAALDQEHFFPPSPVRCQSPSGYRSPQEAKGDRAAQFLGDSRYR